MDDIRFTISAARRMLARGGCDSLIAGHVSARVPGEDNFWISPFEYFDETLPDRLVKVSPELELLEGSWEPSPAVRFHAGFYLARPDANAVIHIHSHYVSVFATTRRLIGMYNVESVLLFEDQALYEDDGEQPAVDPERMVAALGDKRVLLMKNHGAVVVSQSLAAATVEALVVERAARYHIEAEQIGGTEFPRAEALRGRSQYRKYFVPQMWEANLRRLERSDPDLFAWRAGSGLGAPADAMARA